jgi:hypothetical protein
VFIGSLVVAGYVSFYVSLSIRGQYEPIEIGLSGIKSYRWAPRGFVKDLRWKEGRQRLFLPLWYIDTQFWHRDDEVWRGVHPVNNASADEVWQAWREPETKSETTGETGGLNEQR